MHKRRWLLSLYWSQVTFWTVSMRRFSRASLGDKSRVNVFKYVALLNIHRNCSDLPAEKAV
jgi:hypothetical protein